MSWAGTVTMSAKELDRLEVLGRVAERRLTQRRAAEQLGLSERQVRRLCRALGQQGAAGLASRKRGRPSNRKLPASVRDEALALVRERYADFGPRFACEKLVAHHGVAVSTETLRQWMIGAGLWVPRSQRPRRAHQPRHRRSCLGERVQIDGCEHAWFEERGPKCTLLIYVDDATSRLMELGFVASESAFDTFASTRAYLERHGKPVAFYSDKASIFRVAESEARKKPGSTQFGRALSELNIDIICANGSFSPAAYFFDQAPQVSQGAIVANKRLGAVLTRIQAEQRKRDHQRLANPKLTLRQKQRIRAAQANADAAAPRRAAG